MRFSAKSFNTLKYLLMFINIASSLNWCTFVLNFSFPFFMKKLLLFLPAVLLLLASCASRSEADLLKTVPADSNFVAIINPESFTATDPAQMAAICSSLDNLFGSAEGQARWEYILSDDSGVDFSLPMVAFEYKRATVVSFMLKNAGKFREGLKSEENVFIHCSQAWLTPDYPEVSGEDIEALAALNEKQAVLSHPIGKMLVDSEAGLCLIANLDRLLSPISYPSVALMRSMLFDGASFYKAEISVAGQEVMIESSFLTADALPAHFVPELTELDIPALENFKGKGYTLAAIGVNPNLMNMLIGRIKAFGILPSEVSSMLKNLDGDVALCLTPDSVSPFSGVDAMLSFSSASEADQACEAVKSFASMLGDEVAPAVSAEGNFCFISNGNSEGSSFSEVAQQLKGATAGVVFTPGFFEAAPGDGLPLHKALILFKKAEGSISISSMCTVNDGASPVVVALNLLNSLCR